MKKFALISIILFSVMASFGQVLPPFINNTSISNGQTIYHIKGAVKGDVSLMLPVVDTLNNPATGYVGSLTVRPQDTLINPDNPAIYMSNGRFWNRIVSGGTGQGIDSITHNADSTLYLAWNGGNQVFSFSTLLRKVKPGTNVTFSYSGDTLVISATGGGGGGGTYTASNGLTMVSNDVQLGGTLTKNTLITADAFHLTVQSATGSDVLQGITVGSGVGVYGQTVTGSGVRGVSTNSGGGGSGVSASAVGGAAFFGTNTSNGNPVISLSKDPTSTNTVSPMIFLTRTTTGTAATGLGMSISFNLETTGGSTPESNSIISKWTNATTGNQSSQLVITGVVGASTSDLVTLSGNGSVKLNHYGLGTYIGFPTYRLGVDDNGNITEIALGDTARVTLQQAYDNDPTPISGIHINAHGGTLVFDSTEFTSIARSGLSVGIVSAESSGSTLRTIFNNGDPVNSASAGFFTNGADTSSVHAEISVSRVDYLGQSHTGGINIKSDVLEFYNSSDALGQRLKMVLHQPDTMLTTPTMVYVPDGDTLRVYPFPSGGASTTLQQVFDNEPGGSVLTKQDTISGGSHTLKMLFNGITSNAGVSIQSNSTAATSQSQRLLDVSLSGTNATGQDTYAVLVQNSHVDENGGFNYGVYSSVGGSNSTNIAISGLAEGSGDIGVKGKSSNGYAVFGQSSVGVGVNGQATSGTAIQGIATTGTGVSAQAQSAPGIGLDAGAFDGLAGRFFAGSTATNTIIPAIEIDRTPYFPGTLGIGTSIDYKIVTDDIGLVAQLSNQLVSTWTDIADATRTSAFTITGVNSAVEADLVTVSGSGAIRFHKYGVGTFTGTPAYSISEDASGNLIETAYSGSAGTLDIASGKTLTVSNTLTLAGTDGSTLNYGTGGTLGTNAYTSTSYAPLASPTFTGTPSLPTGTTGVTQSAGNSTTALATTAFVTTADNLKATLASANVFTANGGLSTGTGPAMTLNGTWITGGSASTNLPQLYISQSASTNGNLSVNGTGLGINAPTGFTGDFFNFTLNGVARASMSSAGSLALTTGSFTVVASDAQISAGKLTMVAKQIFYGATNTAAGTTGNQTINKPSGSVNVAAAGTTITVTNSLVTATSMVNAWCMTNDATAYIKNIVVSSGSFVVTLGAAATAETKIGFLVVN